MTNREAPDVADVPTRSHASRLGLVVAACGVGAGILGLLGLLGWITGLGVLASGLPDYQPMSPSSGIALAVLGSVLFVLARQRPGARLSILLAAISAMVSVFALVVAVEYLMGAEHPLGDLLFDPGQAIGTPRTVRMSIPAAVSCFSVGLGVSLLSLWGKRRRARQAASILGSLAAFESLTIVMSYLLEAPLLYQTDLALMAVTTAGGMFLLGTGLVVTAGRDGVLIGMFFGDSVRARLLRSFVPVVVVAIILLEIVHDGLLHELGINQAVFLAGLILLIALLMGAVVMRIAVSVGGAIDRTERRQKETEAALREDARFSEQIITGAQEGIVVYGPDLKYRIWNRFMEELTGIPADRVLGRHPDDVFPFLREAGVIERIERALAGETPGTLDFPFEIQRSGRTGWTSDTCSPLHNADGEIIGAIGTVRDVTERRQTEVTLRQTRDYLENLLNYANAPIIVWDQGLCITRFNHAFEHLTGRMAHEVIGKELYILFPEGDRKEAMAKIERTLTGERWETVEIPIIRKDGAIRIALWNSTNIYADDGTTLLATIAQGQDITERKQVQDELIEQQVHARQHVEAELAKVREKLIRTTRLAAIGEVSASIAHDLRNPLGSVRNAVYYLKHYADNLDPTVLEYLGLIEEDVDTSDRIIRNLLALARGKDPVKQDVDICRTVREEFKRTEPTRDVRCELQLPPEPFLVAADPDQLRQVIRNLLTNALQAMEAAGGKIIVEGVHEPQCDTVVFRDTGPGIAPEIRDRLFEALVTTKTKGVGLGLTISRQIVEHHGGSIQLLPDGEGPGAAFRLQLPKQ